MRWLRGLHGVLRGENNMAKRSTKVPVRTIVVVSDTHSGCRLSLCGRDPIPLDDGGTYHPSKIQITLADWWDEFWGEWVPEWVHDEPFTLVHNGDLVEGVHHRAVTPISHNLIDQGKVACKVMATPLEMRVDKYYQVRGTEAHVGPSAGTEEALAKSLGATPNEDGQFARWDLWLRLGNDLVHFLHHIGTSGSAHHEASAVNAELSHELVEAARWGDEPPTVVVRSHRHRMCEVRLPSRNGFRSCVVTPAWQLKTPFAWRIPGARLAPPQIGGIIIRQGDRGLFCVSKVWHVHRTPTERA